jgi:hypothetical protein
MSNTFLHVEYGGAKVGPVAIKPFFDKSVSNMGLEIYGLSLFEGVFHEEQLTCIENNGIKRYVTGLNEFAPEVKLIKDPDQKSAKIKEIRTVVSELEKEMAANVIDIEDPQFWNKVKLLRPDNDEFWGSITIRCGNTPLYLEPVKDPYDLIKLYAIEAGGFSIVSKSYDDARSRPTPVKFYLDKYEKTATTRTEFKKIRNKALAELQKLFDKNITKLMYVAKIVDLNSVQYKKSTPNDVLYDNMDMFINGEGSEKSATRAAQSFLDTVDLDMETLKIKAIIRDATYLKFIALKSDGFIYHLGSSTMLGKNPSDVIEFLKNPLNEEVLKDLVKKTEKYWND